MVEKVASDNYWYKIRFFFFMMSMMIIIYVRNGVLCFLFVKERPIFCRKWKIQTTTKILTWRNS